MVVKTHKGLVKNLESKYPAVQVKHVDHCNPAAQGDIFCKGDHFAAINTALEKVGATGIDWLPSAGWNKELDAAEDDTADRMGKFISDTMELHKMYLERLQSVKDEGQVDLAPITGVNDTPLLPFAEAVVPVTMLINRMDDCVQRSIDFAKLKVESSIGKDMTVDEIAAIYLYTCESAFYRRINVALRGPARSEVSAYFGYLRVFLSGLAKLPARTHKLWRGVGLNLKPQYPKDTTVTWWGVSSCTSQQGVAKAFMGNHGARTLFEVTPTRATSIRDFSAFTGEEEYILAPGTQFQVTSVTGRQGGLTTVRLQEVPSTRLVA